MIFTLEQLGFLHDLLVRVQIDPTLPPDELERTAGLVAGCRRSVLGAIQHLEEPAADVDADRAE